MKRLFLFAAFLVTFSSLFAVNEPINLTKNPPPLFGVA